jgi:hypothetical protein
MENRAAWHFDKKGVYSVKSAYKVFRTNQVNGSRSGGGGASSSNLDPGLSLLWSKIWNIQCASKVKHFMWRVCHNSHPLRMNLKRKGMVLDTRCVVCYRLDEDGAHLFFKCKSMVKVWEHLALSRERDLLAAKSSAKEVTESIMAMKEEQKSLCCIALWWCWTERNRIREGEQRCDTAGLAHSIQVTAAEWRRHECLPAAVRPCRVRKWEKPAGDLVKVNCDAAYDPITGNGGWGCILLDSSGDVVTALRGRTEALMNVLHGELIACIQGTQAAVTAGVGHVVIETDALSPWCKLSTLTSTPSVMFSILLKSFVAF